MRSKAYRAVAEVEAEFWEQVAATSDEGKALSSLKSLRSTLDGLPDRLAEVLWYVAVDGLSQDEVAEVLEISRATVARDLRDARLLFKEKGLG
jgi:RNA polymerase sigma factor (sigma-70 family)